MVVRVFDFFSGCGGTAWGFKQAGLSIEFGLDNDIDAASTYRRNIRPLMFINQDIKKVSAQEIEASIRREVGPTLFSACAPCQPFSRQNRFISGVDPRRDLLSEFERFIFRWKPEYVFIENVPGMQKVLGSEGPLTRFIDLLRNQKYWIDVRTVLASSYGVPQTRERMVLLASRIAPIFLPAPTHGRPEKPNSTVRDWIGNMPPIQAGETFAHDPDHQAMRLSPVNRARIAATPEGGGRESWSKDLQLRCHEGHRGHSDVYGRLAWDRMAAGLTTRCVSYSNGRFGHPEQHRAISIREAASLQTFPLTFSFVGSMESRARQIGNAVPPLMAFAVGSTVARHWTCNMNEARAFRPAPGRGGRNGART